MSHVDTAFKAVKSTLNNHTLMRHFSGTQVKVCSGASGDLTQLMAAVLRKVTLVVPVMQPAI